MKYRFLAIYFSIFVISLILVTSLYAQPTSFSREELIQYTPFWKGERFPDGRPKVPDEVIERMKYVGITEAWGIIRRPDRNVPEQLRVRTRGYEYQYSGDWKMMHDDVTICGRAMTVHWMPVRPDVSTAILAQGEKDGRGRNELTWGIDQLQKGDVYVSNVAEAISENAFAGDNFCTSIWKLSGNGAIMNGTVRDLEGNSEIEGFNLFVRDFRPPSAGSAMLIGINCPIQIGYATVMPGDVVLAKRMGVIFIPPHLAESVVIGSERTRLRDTFAHRGVIEGRFTASQADGGFTKDMEKEFTQWLKDNMNNMGRFFKNPDKAPSPEFIADYAKQRESGTAR